MKKGKILSLIMAVLLMMTFAVPMIANAADNNIPTITINAPTDQKFESVNVFEAYKVFTATFTGGTEGNRAEYGYTIVEDFKNFSFTVNKSDDTGTVIIGKNGVLSLLEYLQLEANDDTLKVAKPDSAALKLLSRALYAYIEANTISATGTPSLAGDQKSVTITFPAGQFGYYLVFNKSKLMDVNDIVVAYGLTTTDEDPVFNLKADVPSIKKTVSADGINYAEHVTSKIGDTVTYKIVVPVPTMETYTKYEYMVSDTMSKGLTFGSITSVQLVKGLDVKALTANAAAADATTFKYKTPVIDVDGVTGVTTFDIDFGDIHTWNDTYADYDIVITYTAVINEAAVVAPAANDNTVELTYSNNPDDTTSKETTPPSEADVYVIQLDLVKIDGTIDTGAVGYTEGDELLANAKFELYKGDDTTGEKIGTPIELKLITLDNGTEVYRLATADEIAADDYITEFTSLSDGKFFVTGLAAGKYVLVETEAPEGFNAIKDIKITITPTYVDGEMTEYDVDYDPNQTLSVTPTTDADGREMRIANMKGPRLPETGGIGTMIFYSVGGVLAVLLAVVFIVFKKRRALKV